MSKSNWHKIKHETYHPEKEGYGSQESWKDAFHQRLSSGSSVIDVVSSSGSGQALSACLTVEELTKTFRNLIKRIHPDLVGSTPETNAASQKLIEEFAVCKNRFQRKKT